jgi:hypothetical protein
MTILAAARAAWTASSAAWRTFIEAAKLLRDAIASGEIVIDDEFARSGDAGDFLRRLIDDGLLQDGDAVYEFIEELEDAGTTGVLDAWMAAARRIEKLAGQLREGVTLIRDAREGVDEYAFLMQPEGGASVRSLELALTSAILELKLSLTANGAISTELYLMAHADSGLPSTLARSDI